MFGKLKEKLKQAVSVFSKKTEEAVVEKVIEKSVEVKRTKVDDKKKEIKETKKEKPEAKKSSKKEKKKKIKPAPEVREEQKETPKEKAEEVITKKAAEEPKEERSFFKKIFGKKEEEEVEEKEAKEEVIEEIKEEKIEEPEERQSFFGKVKTSLTTKKISAEKFEELFWDLELAFLENNVSVEVIEKIKEDLKKELVDKPLPRDVPRKIEETLKQTLTEILSFDKVDLLELAEKKDKPLVIAFFGINGTGKTTSIAKLAHYFQKNKLSVVLAACDTFRAAAIQQLEEHADTLGVKIIKQDYGADAAAVAFDAIKYAEKNKIKVVLLDTSGRLYSNTSLMRELEKIIRVAKPDLKIFVGESITGNDCIEQAKRFNDLVEMDGAILTKADVDEKGGAPLSISYVIGKPILFLGVGQKYSDFEAFD